MSTSRKRFEAWKDSRYEDRKKRNDVFINPYTRAAWLAWQARDAEIAELVEALRGYGKHDLNCRTLLNGYKPNHDLKPHPCTCGLDALIAKHTTPRPAGETKEE